MKIIVCLDDNNGMLFNKRRQSKDREIIRDLIELVGENTLRINEFSTNLFEESEILPIKSNDFLEIAGENDFCMVENCHVRPCLSNISEIIVYKWNRKYPTDFIFDVNPEAEGFSLKETRNFTGYSHEKITREIYKK
ncbi:MAG: ribonuclease Z [Ruminococcaceae bacterium]|nr:ribonuclease Z [Oscillospiraceae bacterium]